MIVRTFHRTALNVTTIIYFVDRVDCNMTEFWEFDSILPIRNLLQLRRRGHFPFWNYFFTILLPIYQWNNALNNKLISFDVAKVKDKKKRQFKSEAFSEWRYVSLPWLASLRTRVCTFGDFRQLSYEKTLCPVITSRWNLAKFRPRREQQCDGQRRRAYSSLTLSFPRFYRSYRAVDLMECFALISERNDKCSGSAADIFSARALDFSYFFPFSFLFLFSSFPSFFSFFFFFFFFFFFLLGNSRRRVSAHERASHSTPLSPRFLSTPPLDALIAKSRFFLVIYLFGLILFIYSIFFSLSRFPLSFFLPLLFLPSSIHAPVYN